MRLPFMVCPAQVVVKFWAPWCNKCRMIAPFVDDLQVWGVCAGYFLLVARRAELVGWLVYSGFVAWCSMLSAPMGHSV